MKKCSQVNLFSKEGQVLSVPAQLLTASSPYLNSILMTSSSCEYSPVSISLPSASSFTLKLLAQILCLGETEARRGLEVTMTNMRELQDVFLLLGLSIKLCPKLSCAKFAKETGPSDSAVKEELLEELEGNQIIKKKSTVAKMSSSSGKFRQSSLLKEFKKNMRRDLMDQNDNIEKRVEKIDDKAEERSCIVQLNQPEFGMLQDLRVNLVKCDTDGQKSVKKRSANEECERSNTCNICSLKVAKNTSLRRHYREHHGIQDVKVEVTCKDKQIKCSDCGKTFTTGTGLRRHKERHHEGKTYGCGSCDVIFAYRHNLIKHCAVKGHDKALIYVLVDLP